MTIPVLGGVGRYLGKRLKQTMFPLRAYLFLVTKPTTQPLLVPSVSTCLSHSTSCKHTHPVSLSLNLLQRLSLSLSLSLSLNATLTLSLQNSITLSLLCFFVKWWSLQNCNIPPADRKVRNWRREIPSYDDDNDDQCDQMLKLKGAQCFQLLPKK